MENVCTEIRLKGTPICLGIGMGKLVFFTFTEEEVPKFSISVSDIEKEVLRYKQALHHVSEDLYALKKKLDEEGSQEGSSIIEAYFQLIEDPLLTSQILNEIRQTCKNSEFVFQKNIEILQRKFNALEDPFFREKFKDLQAISRRILGYLKHTIRFSLADFPPGSIIFANELAAADCAEANLAFISGFVTNSDGTNSHAAIVAKAQGIPFVTGIDFQEIYAKQDSFVIVDGRNGDVILEPSKNTIDHYLDIQKKMLDHFNGLAKTRFLQAETYDGYKIRLSANIEAATELEMLHQYGGNGVGLFRSEYVFLSEKNFPSEEEQFAIYRNIVQQMKGLPIVIRTFDVGGDKCMINTPKQQKTNPFYGFRAIRHMLKEKEIFKSQLRAILRASAYGDVSLMFPMISTLSEIVEAKALLKEAKEELELNQVPIGKKVLIGSMIEVPSAAIIADILAKECDFLSIGTNDLLQYALAVDRTTHTHSSLYTCTDPSVIRLIKIVVHEANHRGIPVSICGEMAADPRCTSLLIGLGVHELSVGIHSIPKVKNAIRNTSIVASSHLAEKVLSLSTPQEIEACLDYEYRNTIPEDSIFYHE
jgi:phosphoenolpyruvate-protein phosphotransferase (PTS system enzyme I)